MATISRRDFVRGLGSLALMPLARSEPDLILYNGNIWTVYPGMPHAQAVAISGGRFTAVGLNDEVLNLATARTRKVDLGTKTMLPGFNDAHAHPSMAGVNHLRMVACDMSSIADIQAALRKRAAQTPAAEWVLGFLYDDGKTPRPITREDLDEAVPDHPVMVGHRGGHTAFVNSRAFALAGVNEATPDPAGGRFDHDPSGRLNGHVSDNAMAIFTKLTAYKPTREDYRKGVGLITKMMAGKGVTSVCDADAGPEDPSVSGRARGRGVNHARLLPHHPQRDRPADRRWHSHRSGGRIDTVWAPSSSTPTGQFPSEPRGFHRIMRAFPGITVCNSARATRFTRVARKAHAAGWQVATHANGGPGN